VLEAGAQGGDVGAEPLQDARGDSFALAYQGHEQVTWRDLLLIAPQGVAACLFNRLGRLLGQAAWIPYHGRTPFPGCASNSTNADDLVQNTRTGSTTSLIPDREFIEIEAVGHLIAIRIATVPQEVA